MFPFLVPALLKSSWRTVLIVAVVAVVGGQQLSRLLEHFSYLLPSSAAEVSGVYFFLWFPRQLPCFIFGIMLYKWSAERTLPSARTGMMMCIAAIGLMLLFPFLDGVRFVMPLGLQTTYGLAFSLFVFSLMTWQSSPLTNRISIWIGKVSYSAYFVHFGVLYFASLPHVTGSATVDFAIGYVLVVAVTVALSSVTYWIIEQPMIKFGGRLITRRTRLVTRPAMGA